MRGLLLLFVALNAHLGWAAEKYALDSTIPGAIESYYTKRIVHPLKNWPPKGLPDGPVDDNPVWVRGIRTPNQPNYVGVLRRVWIKAPLAKVAELIEDFGHYPDFYEGVIQAEVVKREGNRLTVYWERKSPLFFIPNIKFWQAYLIQRESASKIIYRYQFKNGGSLNAVDGLIVLEATRDGTTLTAFDFFDAKWGLLGSVAPGRIWRDSLEGSYRGDIALKTKAERPTWSVDQIQAESYNVLKHFPIEPIQYLENFNWD